MNDIESVTDSSEFGWPEKRKISGYVDHSTTATERRHALKSLLRQFQEVAAGDYGDTEESDPRFMTQELVEQIESFIVEVAKCYQSYGCPTNTNEVNLRRIAAGLGVKARILVLPTQMFIQTNPTETEPETVRRYSHFFRTSSGFNFYKLRMVDDLVRKISSYAQNSQLDAQTPREQEELIAEAIQRAREHAATISTRFPINTVPSADEEEESLPEWIISEDPDEYGFVDTGDTGESFTQESTDPSAAVEGHEPLTDEIMDTLMCRLSAMSASSHHPKEHDYAAESKLAQLILIMASVGPDVYSAQGFDADDEEEQSPNHHYNYRNLFLKLALEDGVRLIRAIEKQDPQYSIWFKILWTGISSFGSCGLFYGGSWIDCALSGILGSVVASIEQISTVSPTFSRIFEFTATFTVSMIIRVLNAHYKHIICYDAVLISSIVYYLQGAGITIGFVDMLTKDIVSGTTQVMLGVLISAMIGFAIDLSTSTYAEIVDRSYSDVLSDSVCENAVGLNWFPFMFILVIVGFVILLESHVIQFPAMIVISACCYAVYHYVEIYFNNEIATVLSAFTASALSNLYSRRTGRAAVVYIIPAIFLLVPDSTDNSSFYTVLLDRKGSPALTFAVASSALSIAVGIFAASVLAPVPDVEEIFRTAQAAFPGAHKSRSSAAPVRKEIYVNSGLKY